MPFWDRGEVDKLNSEIRLLRGKIEALSDQLQRRIDRLESSLEYRDKRLIDGVTKNLHQLDHTIDKLGIQIETNKYLIERAIAVAEENQMQIGEIRNNQISIFSSGINNKIHDQSVNNIYLNPQERQTLAKAAKEIQDLLDQLSQTYPTTTQTEKAIFAAKAVEQIEQNPTLKMRVVGAIKACGITALQEAVDNPIFNVVSAFLQGFIEPPGK
ncbi:hypothetical protein H6G93_29095 [Nostoc sp. FACHB-973]|nr:hypothetical protein [Nostoc sp. FACHB-973]MBX9254900.1 hypothetical protein [Desmonostoc muscorum CCALA 125]